MVKDLLSGRIEGLIKDAQRIVIIQADNPDGDSLGSSLALEHILGDQGKDVHLYCGVDMPTHLTYMKGWDRVSRELPKQFDLSIIVDANTDTLLEQLDLTNQKMWLKNKPCIVIDHHGSEANIPYATEMLTESAVATAEIIYELASTLTWQLNKDAKTLLTAAILSDSLGLTSEATSGRTIHIVAEMVDDGVSIAELEASRRKLMRRSPDLVHYKGQLLQRVEYYFDNRIAVVSIPWDEIERYSHAYNPSILVLDDMRLTENTEVALAFKIYQDGKVTCKIRCNYGATIAGKLAAKFGGGGHDYASGFKIKDGRNFDDIKRESVAYAAKLLDELKDS